MRDRSAVGQEVPPIMQDMPQTQDAVPGFALGPFLVDPAGGLVPMEPGTPPRFTFRWRDRLLHASLLPGEAPDRQLRLRTRLARVPSSARPHEAARREQSFALLRDLHRTLPAAWRLGLAPDHGVVLEATARVAAPMTATSLISEVTVFLLTLAPYLDVLDEAGLDAPAGGNENTCPG